MKNKLIWLLGLSVVLTACDVDNTIDPIEEPVVPEVALSAGSANFSKYVAIGASFTAGFTDGALFKASQGNSFPNIMSKKFAMANGGTFTQPLMNDNIGGFLIGGTQFGAPRFYFNGTGPVRLNAAPTTEIGVVQAGPYSNMGVPGMKSFHLGVQGYGALAALPNANPYFIRMASAPTASVLQDALAQSPTFFSISEIGGNDVLGYAIGGGVGVDQANNFNPATYGPEDITSPVVFNQVFGQTVDLLTAGGAKGIVANIPYVTSLSYFTTVPYAPLDPSNPAFGPQIPTLNTVFGALNQIFMNPAINQPNRVIVFKTTEANPVVIRDESLVNLSAQITGGLLASPQFPAFVQSFGLPAQAAPLVASLLGNYYGQARQATADDLLVLPSSGIIGTINTNSVAFLMSQGLSQQLAGMFSAEGVSLPLEDKWVLTADEVSKVKTATDAYNATIKATATAKGLAFVDFKAILQEASTTGIATDDFVLTTGFVTGGLISLDGIHLTARGYAVMANKMLEAIDEAYGSNFTKATSGLAKVGNYPTHYNPALR